MTPPFVGCKIALLYQDQILSIQRDDKPGLRFANMWDLPGGGREGSESPEECVMREVHEELGITLDPAAIIWEAKWPAMHDPSLDAYFFAIKLSDADVQSIKFGDEGQSWRFMRIQEFMSHENVVPHLKERLAGYLDSLEAAGSA